MASNNIVKLEAVEERINLCINLNIKRIMIEEDSHIIINAHIKGKTPNLILNSKLETIINHLKKIEEVRFSHIYREGNKEANIGTDGINSLMYNHNL